MQTKVTVSIIVGIVIVVGVIGYQMYETTWIRTTSDEYYDGVGKGNIAHVVYPDNPQNLYGLQINKDKYLLGESVYVKVTDIPPQLKTEIIFYTPSGKQFFEIKVDGEKTSGFKQYFKPQLLMNRQLCDVNALIGNWVVIFINNPGEKLYFEMTDEYLPGNEKYFEASTCGITKEIPFDPNYIKKND